MQEKPTAFFLDLRHPKFDLRSKAGKQYTPDALLKNKVSISGLNIFCPTLAHFPLSTRIRSRGRDLLDLAIILPMSVSIRAQNRSLAVVHALFVPVYMHALKLIASLWTSSALTWIQHHAMLSLQHRDALVWRKGTRLRKRRSCVFGFILSLLVAAANATFSADSSM